MPQQMPRRVAEPAKCQANWDQRTPAGSLGHIRCRQTAAHEADRVTLDISTYDWVVVPIPVLVKAGLAVVVLAGEPQVVRELLPGYASGRRYIVFSHRSSGSSGHARRAVLELLPQEQRCVIRCRRISRHVDSPGTRVPLG